VRAHNGDRERTEYAGERQSPRIRVPFYESFVHDNSMSTTRGQDKILDRGAYENPSHQVSSARDLISGAGTVLERGATF